jgi:hypothetical protein
MLSSDEKTRTTDALERVPRILDRRSVLNERRQNILQQKQTDVLPRISGEISGSRAAWRQVTLLREENKHLRSELDVQRTELQRIENEYTALQAEFDKEADIIHNGYRQEIEQYQSHMRELMEERNHLQEAHQETEQRYLQLYHTFRDTVEAEAQKIVTTAIQTQELPFDATTLLVEHLRKTVERQVRQEEDKHLLEAMYLKREMQRLIQSLEQERQQVKEEIQRLLHLQNSAREQAELRQKVLRAQMRARWQFKTFITTAAAMITLIVFQWICVLLFHVPVTANLSVALIGPIIAGILCVAMGTRFFTMSKPVSENAPQKKNVKRKV